MKEKERKTVRMRIRHWTKLSSSALWQVWLNSFDTVAEAEATAIFIANRLVKDRARSTRRSFYEVKDMFMRAYQPCLVDGQIAREEELECYCDGTMEWCRKCLGTGIYRTRTLYLHRFMIEGKPYSFHSYQKPTLLSSIPGEDKETYGGRFTEAELAELALPVSGLIRMLRFHAFSSGFNKKISTPVEMQGDMYAEESHMAL